MEDLEAIARSVMSSDEWMSWLAIPTQNQMRAFYRLWARKEAYLKAIGLGLFRSLQGVTVPVTAEPLDAGTTHLVRDLAGAGVWQVVDVELGPGFAAAVSAEGTDSVRLAVRELNLDRNEANDGFGG
jgi:4'-phosphopantetheinyl transferase